MHPFIADFPDVRIESIDPAQSPGEAYAYRVTINGQEGYAPDVDGIIVLLNCEVSA